MAISLNDMMELMIAAPSRAQIEDAGGYVWYKNCYWPVLNYAGDEWVELPHEQGMVHVNDVYLHGTVSAAKHFKLLLFGQEGHGPFHSKVLVHRQGEHDIPLHCTRDEALARLSQCAEYCGGVALKFGDNGVRYYPNDDKPFVLLFNEEKIINILIGEVIPGNVKDMEKRLKICLPAGGIYFYRELYDESDMEEQRWVWYMQVRHSHDPNTWDQPERIPMSMLTQKIVEMYLKYVVGKGKG